MTLDFDLFMALWYTIGEGNFLLQETCKVLFFGILMVKEPRENVLSLQPYGARYFYMMCHP